MEPITLSELLKAVDGTLLGDYRDENAVIERVDTDSRKIHPGALFIPLVGERFDGRIYGLECKDGTDEDDDDAPFYG